MDAAIAFAVSYALLSVRRLDIPAMRYEILIIPRTGRPAGPRIYLVRRASVSGTSVRLTRRDRPPDHVRDPLRDRSLRGFS